ncbi:MAG: hypothetical protein ABW092_01130 [Candidatus Thiodiazotropha sp.]
MQYFLFFSLLSLCILFPVQHALAGSESERKALQEMQRQLGEWKRQGRIEDLKIIKSRKSVLVEQVKSGQVDLQAIVDEYNKETRTTQSPLSRHTDPVLALATVKEVPQANRPIAAYTYLDNQWSGFPAMLTQVAKQAYVFPNGMSVYCANWDPRQLDPTPNSVGRMISNCDVRKGNPEGKQTKKFAKGQTIDISFGNVRGDSRDLGGGSSSTISGSTLRMTRDGRIEIGKFNAFTVSSGGDGAGGGNRKRALQGRYALDGHLIAITTTQGETQVGFISWSSDGGGDSIDHVFINGEHFWDRSN